jgi:hypothetical protein
MGVSVKQKNKSGQIDVTVSVLKLNSTTLVCTAYGYEMSVRVKLMLYTCYVNCACEIFNKKKQLQKARRLVLRCHIWRFISVSQCSQHKDPLMSPLFPIHDGKTKDKQTRNRGGEVHRRQPPQTRKTRRRLGDVEVDLARRFEWETKDWVAGSIKERD